MKTLQRYIPKDYIEYRPNLGYPKDMFACYVSRSDEKPSAIFYKGKGGKPVFHNRFYSLESMKEKINKTISNLMSYEDRKEERKTQRLQESQLKVGDILYTSWGYDQTNVDFYQVTEVIGKRSVEVRPISQKLDSNDGASCDYVLPVKDSFTGVAKKHLVKYGNRIKIADYADATLFDGQSKYQTASGYGH